MWVVLSLFIIMLHLSSFWTKAAGHWCSVTGGEGRAGLCVTSLARKVLPKTSSFAWIWCWDHAGPLSRSCSRGWPFPRGGGPTRCLPQPGPHRVPSPFPYRPPRCLLPSGVETLALETDLLLSAVLLLAVIRNQVQHHPESQSFVETCLSHTMARCCSVAHTLWATWVYMITEDAVNVVSMEKNAVCVPVSCRWSCSVAKSCLTLWPHELQHAELSCPSLTFKKGKLYGIHTQLIHHSDFPWNCTYTLHNQICWASERMNQCGSLKRLAYCSFSFSTNRAFVPSFPFLPFYFVCLIFYWSIVDL